MNARVLVPALAAAMTLSLAAQTTQPPPTQGAGQVQGRGGGGQGAGRGGQQPARDAQPQQPVTGTGIIAGLVVTEGSGAPVRRARVNLSAPELRGARSVLTDDDGKFSFSALPAGRYSLQASKPGYVNITFGAKRPGRPGTPIQLVDGQKLEKANISLPRGAVITGVVIDEHGEPSPGTQVRAMRAVMQTGEKTYQQAGQDQTDDRGIYRIYGLQPGEYIVNAVPRNTGAGDMQQALRAELEALTQQFQALAGRGGAGAAGGGAGVAGGGAGGGAAGGGRAGRGAALGGADLQFLLGGGGRGQALIDRAAELQQQLQQGEQPTAYAPVFYPGTTTPSTAAGVALAVGEERAGIDFQLQLVPTARVEGSVQGADGVLPQGTQVTLVAIDQGGGPVNVPGLGTSSTRVNQAGRFQFSNVNPGQYRITARATVRDQTAAAPAGRGGLDPAQRGGGPGGRGGPAQITQVYWATADLAVGGQNIGDLMLTLQPGMTITGRVLFDGSILPPPADLTQIRVTVSPRGQQPGVDGPIPPAVVDATGQFTIKGVAPGKYSLSANVPSGAGRGGGAGLAGAPAAGGRAGGAGGAGQAAPQWVLRTALTSTGDALDFGFVVEPNQNIVATLTFADRTQEISGTIQDTTGRPTADYTIIVFPSDRRYWVPQARRIRSSRPGTDGRFTFSNLPAGDYRLTAVTDVEPGEWFDPDFLSQLLGASVPVQVGDGEKKVQDLRVAGGV